MKNKIYLNFFIALLIAFNTLFCLAKGDDIKVVKFDNGYTVVIKEIHSNPIVMIDTWVKTGSINETDANNGVAHFLEHLFFKGTCNHKRGEFEKILESKGGVFNAETSKDYTHYYIKIASNYFDTALDLQSDMLLNVAIPQDELDMERKVVQEEIRRGKDEPSDILFENLNSILFKQHPYKRKVIGTEQIVGSIPRDKIFEFHDKWYTPANMTTVIVGDVDADKILPLVKAKFMNCQSKTTGGKVRPSSYRINYPKEAYITQKTEKIAKGKYNTGYLMIGFKGTDISNKKDNYALDLAAIILGDGRTSRLYQSIKEKKHLATSIDAGNFSMRDDGIFYVSATFDPQKYNELNKAIVQELHTLASSKVTDEELQKAKTLLQRSYIYSNESVGSISNSLGYDMTVGGDISYYTEYLNDINKITANDITLAVNKYIRDNRMAVSVVLPDSTPNIKPVSNVCPSAKLESTNKGAEKINLKNGIDLILDKNKYNDIVSLSVFVKGGSYIDSIPGISSVIAGTLTKGTKTKNSLEIAKELENSGIVISPSSDDDYFEISFKSTKEDFDKAFAVLEDIIKNPIFPEEYVEKTKKDMMDDIKSSRDTPFSVALDNFNTIVYKGHPYGNTSKILEKTIPTIQRKDVVKFYRQVFDPKNMVVSVSGNFDNEDIIKKFSGFKSNKFAKTVDEKKLATSLKLNPKNINVVAKKDTETGWLLMGWSAPGIRSQKDFATLKVIGAVLGGGMSSRLFKDLREEQGLAYEVSAGYPTNLDKSAFVMYIGTKPDNLVNVKGQFLAEMQKIINEPLCEEELESVKSKLIGQYALSMETNAARAHSLGAYETMSKGYKFYFDYPELIITVSVQDIMDVAKKYLDKPYVLSVIGPENKVKAFDKEVKVESKR
jgi:zinc protease